jgi:hypothetical protein
MKLSLPNNSIRSCLLALASVLILPAPAAHADVIDLFADLSFANERPTPPVPSLGTGSAHVVLDTTAQTLTVSATFSGLTGPATAAHIHCCQTAFDVPPAVGVATAVPSFPGFPLNMGDLRSDAVLSGEPWGLQSGLRRHVPEFSAGRGSADRGTREPSDLF